MHILPYLAPATKGDLARKPLLTPVAIRIRRFTWTFPSRSSGSTRFRKICLCVLVRQDVSGILLLEPARAVSLVFRLHLVVRIVHIFAGSGSLEMAAVSSVS